MRIYQVDHPRPRSTQLGAPAAYTLRCAAPVSMPVNRGNRVAQ
jgi:hypothetical protein